MGNNRSGPKLSWIWSPDHQYLIVRLYWQGYTINNIAESFEVCGANVVKVLESLNIPRRRNSEAQKKATSKASKQYWKAWKEQNPCELRIIEKERGISYEHEYELLRWYWQGYTLPTIEIAADCSYYYIKKAIRKYTPLDKRATRKRDDCSHKKEIILNRILKKYGPDIYKMWTDYPNNPDIDYAILAEAMNISYEAVRKRMTILYGYRTEPNAKKGISKLKGLINTRETLSSQILSEYGPDIHKIVMDYPNDPMMDVGSIGDLLGISSTAAGTKLKILHGECKYKNKLRKYCATSKITVPNEHIQFALDENEIEIIYRNGKLYKTKSGASFLCRKLLKFKPTNEKYKYYRVSYANTDIDYFICWCQEDNSIYIIPGRQNSSSLYFNEHSLDRYKNNLHLLK
jgi:hypothetical protein